jgi:hypothetical protein
VSGYYYTGDIKKCTRQADMFNVAVRSEPRAHSTSSGDDGGQHSGLGYRETAKRMSAQICQQQVPLT